MANTTGKKIRNKIVSKRTGNNQSRNKGGSGVATRGTNPNSKKEQKTQASILAQARKEQAEARARGESIF